MVRLFCLSSPLLSVTYLWCLFLFNSTQKETSHLGVCLSAVHGAESDGHGELENEHYDKWIQYYLH